MTAYALEGPADRHLEDIYAYTLARWGEAQARDYIGGLTTTFRAIADGAIKGRRIVGGDRSTGFVCRHGHHYVYWRIRADRRVGIVAILHERMEQATRSAAAWRDLT